MDTYAQGNHISKQWSCGACGLYTTGPQSTVEGRVILVNGTTKDEHSKLLCWWKNAARLGSRVERDPDLYVMLHNPGHSDMVTQQPHWVAQFVSDFVVVMKLCISQHGQGPWGSLWVSFFCKGLYGEASGALQYYYLRVGRGWLRSGFLRWLLHYMDSSWTGNQLVRKRHGRDILHGTPCAFQFYTMHVQILSITKTNKI